MMPFRRLGSLIALSFANVLFKALILLYTSVSFFGGRLLVMLGFVLEQVAVVVG